MVAKLNFRTKLYALNEEREMKPSTCANLLSAMLYERRFGPYFVEPIVVGLEDKYDSKTGETTPNVPYIAAMDLIGALVFTEDFLVGGTSSEELYGICEAMYKPNQEPDDLFETISQCLLAAVDRDCLAGWGAEVVMITPDGITVRQLKARQD